MNEHGFAKKVTSALRKQGVPKVWKINDNYAGGVPDAYFLGVNTSIWIEFKWLAQEPKRETTKIVPKLSAQQVSWANALHKSDKKIWIVVGSPRGVFLLKEPELWHPESTLSNGQIKEAKQEGARYFPNHNEFIAFLYAELMQG